jgi:hypothetical protein
LSFINSCLIKTFHPWEEKRVQLALKVQITKEKENYKRKIKIQKKIKITKGKENYK